jgi:hypothetical protein
VEEEEEEEEEEAAAAAAAAAAKRRNRRSVGRSNTILPSLVPLPIEPRSLEVVRFVLIPTVAYVGHASRIEPLPLVHARLEGIPPVTPAHWVPAPVKADEQEAEQQQ